MNFDLKSLLIGFLFACCITSCSKAYDAINNKMNLEDNYPLLNHPLDAGHPKIDGGSIIIHPREKGGKTIIIPSWISKYIKIQ